MDSEKNKFTGFSRLAVYSLSMINFRKAIASRLRNLNATATTISRLYTS